MKKLIAVGMLLGAMVAAMARTAPGGTICHQVGAYTYCN
jgi:hypothetical protein